VCASSVSTLEPNFGHRMFSSISGLYPLDNTSTFPNQNYDNQSVPRYCQILPGGKIIIPGWNPPFLGTNELLLNRP
jgi:hypothetical protein